MRVDIQCSHYNIVEICDIMQVLANIVVVIILQYEVHWINMLYTLNLHNVSIQLYLSIAGKAFNFSSHCGCLKFLQFYIITIFIKQRNMLSIKNKKNVFIWTIMFEYIIYLINIILLYIYFNLLIYKSFQKAEKWGYWLDKYYSLFLKWK